MLAFCPRLTLQHLRALQKNVNMLSITTAAKTWTCGTVYHRRFPTCALIRPMDIYTVYVGFAALAVIAQPPLIPLAAIWPGEVLKGEHWCHLWMLGESKKHRTCSWKGHSKPETAPLSPTATPQLFSSTSHLQHPTLRDIRVYNTLINIIR